MSVEHKEKYYDDVVSFIEDQRKIGLENIQKSDLFTSEETTYTMKWFDRLLNCIERSPPQMYVSTLQIEEDQNQEITGVSYRYQKRKSKKINIEIKYEDL